MSAMEIVQALGIPGKRGFYWLQLLENMGILENGTQGYRPSSLSREAILGTRREESWKHLVVDERERVAGVSNLALYLCEPGSIWAAQGLPARKNYVDKMRADPARAREFTRMLFEVHQPLAKAVSELLGEFLDSLEDPNFSVPTFGQIQSMLTEAGFQVSPGRHTLGSGWVVFQARKRS